MSRFLIFSLFTFSILSLILGFSFNEDLSSGGSRYDFYLTLNVIKNLANLNLVDYSEYTRHFPLHYFLLAVLYNLFNDDLFLRIIYLIFSSLFPIFLFLNLNLISKLNTKNILFITAGILFLPFFRSSAIWPNSHLTAIIFFLIGNFFYLLGLSEKKIYKYLNLFFLSLATYSVQTYAIFYMFYLFYYYKNSNFKEFGKLFLFCIFLSIPGFIFILSSEGGRSLYGLAFSKNLSFSLITNFSIIFFYYCFFIFNPKNINSLKKSFFKIKKKEFIFLFLFFLINIYFYDKNDSYIMLGSGFFYKLSIFLTQNTLLFFLSSFFGFFISLLIIKKDAKFLFILLLINIMSSHYLIYQKYFEPIFIIMILVLFKNFLTENVISSRKNTLIFISLIFVYYIVSIVNSYLNISKSLLGS